MSGWLAWGGDFYDRTALWFGSSAVLEGDRARAYLIDEVAAGSLRVLELGAGFGGSAAATADLGHDVVAVERSRWRAALARLHMTRRRMGRLEIVEADFTVADIDGNFDVVAYWNGFGVGDDRDQQHLLRRIAAWLRPNGRALVDVFHPTWWQHHAGQVREEHGFCQRLDFLSDQARLVTRWWPVDRPSAMVRETIRCYTYSEFAALLQGTGLVIRHMPDAGRDGAQGIEDRTYLVELERA